MTKYMVDIAGSGKPGFAHSCFHGASWNSGTYPYPVLKALPTPVGTNNKSVAWWRQI